MSADETGSGGANAALLKELIVRLAESDDDERRELLAALKLEHPDLVDDLDAYFPFVAASDEDLLGGQRAEFPSEIGGFVVQRRLGRGGMGEVFLAQEPPPLSRLAAVKVIRAGLLSRRTVRRLEFEREVLTSLDHPNVARVLGGGTTGDGLPFVAMEFVDGVPLDEWAAGRSADAEARLRCMLAVCAGVSHAHTKGLVHRDLKPSNILVSNPSGEDAQGAPVPKLIDFGIAKQVTEGGASLETMPGAPIGTLEYMSPEQAQGLLSQVDQRSDIYSLGVILYELLAGELPHSGEEIVARSGGEFLRAMESAGVRSIADVVRRSAGAPILGLPSDRLRELDWIAQRAMQVDPEQRYQTCRELCADLERFLAGQPVVAAPPSRVYRLRRMARRHRTALAAGLLAVAAVIALVVVLLVSNRATRAALSDANAANAARTAALAESEATADFLVGMVYDPERPITNYRRSVAQMIYDARSSVEELGMVGARGAVRTLVAEVERLNAEPEKALQQVERALDELARSEIRDPLDEGRALLAKARILDDLQRGPDALEAFDRALERFDAAGARGQLDGYATRARRADTVRRVRGLGAALEAMDSLVVAWRDSHPRSEALVDVLLQRAGYRFSAGQNEGASKDVEEARGVVDENPSMDHSVLESALILAMRSARTAGNPVRGQRVAMQLASLTRQTYGDYAVKTLQAEMMVAEFATDPADMERQIVRLEEIAAIVADFHDGHPVSGFASYVRGTLLRRLHRLEAAIAAFRRSLQDMAAARGSVVDPGVTHLVIAQVLCDLRRWDEALEHAKKARQMLDGSASKSLDAVAPLLERIEKARGNG